MSYRPPGVKNDWDEEAIVDDYRNGRLVANILEGHGVGSSTLYRILIRHDIPLRGQQAPPITVMDPNGSPALVERTPENLALRAEQITHAYQGEHLISDILHRWRVNTKTLYKIVPPGRYAKSSSPVRGSSSRLPKKSY